MFVRGGAGFLGGKFDAHQKLGLVRDPPWRSSNVLGVHHPK
jgi:hypothetical protein